MASESFDRGVAVFKKIGSPSTPGAKLPTAFRDMTMSHLFGDVWARPGLELRERALLTLATTAALGREPLVRVAIRTSLNLGLTREQIEEAFIHLAHYAGWPVGVMGCQALSEIVEERERQAAREPR
jgi:4-carboxymuconolactone decarboxylase